MKAYIILGLVVLSSYCIYDFMFQDDYKLFYKCFEPFEYEYENEQFMLLDLERGYMSEFAKDNELSFHLTLLGEEEVSGKFKFDGRFLHANVSFFRKLFTRRDEFLYFVEFNGEKGLIDRSTTQEIGVIFTNGLDEKCRILSS